MQARRAVQCTTCGNSRWRSRRPGWSVRRRSDPSGGTALSTSYRPPAGAHAASAAALFLPTTTRSCAVSTTGNSPPRWRPRADRRARWGGGTWHHPPRHPRRRKSLFWQTAACMIRYGRWPGPSVPPPGCPVCPGPLMDKYQRFFFCPTSRAPPSCACMPWEQFHSSIGHPRLSDASTCIVLSTTTTGLLKRKF